MEVLRVAHANACTHAVDQVVCLICADLLPPVCRSRSFDLICANLPYIPTHELRQLRVSKREPCLALDGGEDGLTLVRRLLDVLPGALSNPGRALFEIGAEQAPAVLDHLARVMPEARSEVRADLAGLQRLVVVDRTG